MRYTRCAASLAICLGSLSTAHALTNTIITACVGKFGGLTRIVAAPSACDTRLENVIQFAQQGPAGPAGPTGPTGPQGPAGPTNNQPFLTRTLIVAASGTPQQNGQLLSEIANAAASVATATNPYMIQLDAGYYDVGPGLYVAPYISFKGAGMYSTFVTSTGTAIYLRAPSDDVGAVFSISDMSILVTDTSTAMTGRSIASAAIERVLLDHLYVNSPINLGAVISTPSFLLSNSIVHAPLYLSSVYGYATSRFVIVGSEVDSFNPNSIAPYQACFSTYNARLVPYSLTCQ